MSHETVYAGRKVAYHVRNEADVEKVRKIAREVMELMKAKGRYEAVTCNVVGDMAILEII